MELPREPVPPGHLPPEPVQAGSVLPVGLFLGIDHVGYAVPDLDEALALHARLGWLPVHRERNEAQGVEEAVLAPVPVGRDAPASDASDAADTAGTAGATDTVGTAGAARVQLLAPLSADSPIGRYLDRLGPGIQQVAYRVADLDAVSAELVARGFRLVHPEPGTGTGGDRINFLHPRDTGGVLIELVEPARPCPGAGPGRLD